jgi:galactokinase
MVALLQLLSAFCCFSSLLSFWLPWIYSPFPFCMEFRNGVLLQLIECIESTRNEVKRKMIETVACNFTPKSHAHCAREKIARAHRNFISFVAVRTVRSLVLVTKTTSHLDPRFRAPPNLAGHSTIYNGAGLGSNESFEGAHLCPVQTIL